jgi:hypothetical protein
MPNIENLQNKIQLLENTIDSVVKERMNDVNYYKQILSNIRNNLRLMRDNSPNESMDIIHKLIDQINQEVY